MANTWRDRIGTAFNNEGFCEQDIDASGDWPSCAVGEAVRARLSERQAMELITAMNRPVLTSDQHFCDTKLYVLGVQFDKAVRDDRFVTASKLYNDIQAEVSRL